MVAERVEGRSVIPLAEFREQLDEVLARVEEGETVTITRDGKIVAKLSPVSETQVGSEEGRDEAQRFLEEVRELRGGRTTGVTREEILAWRHEGHRR